MDPGANLREQLKLARKIIHDYDRTPESPDSWTFEIDGVRLAELVIAHQEWRDKAGFTVPPPLVREPELPPPPYRRKAPSHTASMPADNQPDSTGYKPPWHGVFSILDPPENTA